MQPSPPRPVVNLLNVAAKVKKDVPQGVYTESQVGTAVIFAVVTVTIPITQFNVFRACSFIVVYLYSLPLKTYIWTPIL